MEQRTDDWYQARLGRVTASRVVDVMAKTKSGYSATRKNYLMQLLCERLTGKPADSYSNAAMQRGTDMEPVARSWYEIETGNTVSEVGFILHPGIEMCGASPDGLIGSDGLIEIKCPNTATHVEFLQTGKIENKYMLQMQLQMVCTGRSWCDFLSYDDRLPEQLQGKITRVERDNNLIAEMEAEIIKFLTELDSLEREMRGMMAA